jgi:hypothetical protein
VNVVSSNAGLPQFDDPLVDITVEVGHTHVYSIPVLSTVDLKVKLFEGYKYPNPS